MATLTETQDVYDRHHLHVGVIHSDVADVIMRIEAERDDARAELKTRTQEYIRLIKEAQALMRPQGEWEARESAIKQVVIEALESIDAELHAGAQFDNLLLAVSARIALAWMDLEKAA